MEIRAEGKVKSLREAKDAPFVSAIIPCRNEGDYIEAAVRSVLANDWPRDRLEVLVVDGMSDDGTREIVSRMAKLEPRVKPLDNPARFTPEAVNIGVGAARGDYIMRMDAHGEIPADYIARGVAVLKEKPEVWSVGGPVSRVGKGESGRFVAAVTTNIFSTGNINVRLGEREGPVDALAYPLWRRAVFARVGSFDESLVRNQDDDFDLRIRQAGGIIYQTPKMRAVYYVRSTVGKLLSQYLQYAFWKVVVAKKRRCVLGWKPLVPSAFFATLGLTLLAGFLAPYVWLAGGALAAAYLGADVVASVSLGIRKGFGNILRAFFVFPALHFAYAAGITSGVWYCYVRRFSSEEIKRRRLFAGLTR